MAVGRCVCYRVMSDAKASYTQSSAVRTLQKAPPEEAVAAQALREPEDLRPGQQVERSGYRRGFQSRLWAALPIFTAAVLALLASSLIFPFLSENHDEPVYLLQAEALRAGSLTVKAPAEDAVSFRPWLTALRDGRYVFKYTPVHAAFLATGRNLFGSYRASLALIAAGLTAGFLLLAGELLRSRRAALTATWAFLLSPMVLVLNSTFLSYSSSLMLLVTFAGLLLRGLRRKSLILLALSGLMLGFGFFARPLDAIVVSLPLFIHFLLGVWKRPDRFQLVGSFSAGAAGPLVLAGLFNETIMGSPFSFPFSVLDGLDSLGFGLRRLVPGHHTFDYDLGSALTALAHQTLWLPAFTFGGPVLLGLFGLYLFRRQAKGAERALAWTAVTIPIAYLFFWGPYHTGVAAKWGSMFGPFYWMPMLVPLSLLGTKAWSELRARRPQRAKLVAAVMVFFTAGGIAQAATSNYRVANKDQDIYQTVAAVEQARRRALILVPSFQGHWLLHPFPSFRNDLNLRNDTIYAVSRGSKNVELALSQSDRDVYQLRLIDRGQDREVSVVPSRVVSAPTFDVGMHIVNTYGRRYVAVQVIRGWEVQWAVIDTSSVKGSTYDLTFTLSADGAHGLDWRAGTFRNKQFPLGIAAYFSDRPDFRYKQAVEERFWHHVNSAGELQLLTPSEVYKGSGTARSMRWKPVKADPTLKLEVTPRQP